MGCSGSTNKEVVPKTQTGKQKTTPAQSKQPGKSASATPEKGRYDEVDAHARKAPGSLKGSIENLVNYLSTPSKQPEMLVRAFFVWMSENIRYDVDGYFGRSERAACDALSVIQSGKCVCEGYANVMDALCRQANINVKKISGYAKGVGHSEDHVISTNENTNHAWNAVELNGSWFLVDSTWGAGHLDRQNVFKKEFNEFYFLAKPDQLINTHFPYMNNDMKESMKWQLLKNPVPLDKFNKTVRRWPSAYKYEVDPVTHTEGFYEVADKFEMTFKVTGKKDIVFTSQLMHYDGNMIREIQNITFGMREGNLYKVQMCFPKEGKYDFTLFGKEAEKEGTLDQLFKYLLKCKKPANPDFRFPEAYIQAQIDRCTLHEPIKNNLPANSEVKVSVSSPVLARVMVNQTFLTKTGNRFVGTVTTGEQGSRMGVFGSRVESGSLGGQYVFDIQ